MTQATAPTTAPRRVSRVCAQIARLEDTLAKLRRGIEEAETERETEYASLADAAEELSLPCWAFGFENADAIDMTSVARRAVVAHERAMFGPEGC